MTAAEKSSPYPSPAREEGLQIPQPAKEDTPVLRRRWLTWGVGIAGALGGASAALWHRLPRAVPDSAAQALWQASLNDPQGTPVAMASFQGKPLILNFWATWCPPCVEELPLLNRFYAEHRSKGWQVVGLAMDQPSNVRQFLQRQPLQFPIVLGGMTGTDLVQTLLGNEKKGALPFTLLFAANGDMLVRKIGKLSENDLHTWTTML